MTATRRRATGAAVFSALLGVWALRRYGPAHAAPSGWSGRYLMVTYASQKGRHQPAARLPGTGCQRGVHRDHQLRRRPVCRDRDRSGDRPTRPSRIR